MVPIRILPTVLLFLILASPFPARAQGALQASPYDNPEALVRELYTLVTFNADKPPDWDKVRNVFLPQAVIVLRTSRDSTSVFDVEGFVQDFVTFIERSPAKQAGFEEKVVTVKAMVLGDIARVTVLYQAHIPGTKRPPQQGVDVFLLNKRGGRWWITSIVNEIPTPDNPVPEELRAN
jgi:hypothetical protein